MSSWHDRFVTQARSDGQLRRKLHELARLDSQAMANANNALSPEWSRQAQSVDRLCDEVAARVAEPGEDVGEVAQWISYNCQSVARSLPPAGPSLGGLIPLVLAVVVAVIVFRLYHNWILTVLSGLAVISLVSWLRSARRAAR